MSTRFAILPGLPPYVPLPFQFGVRKARYQEGLVVELHAENGTWVGNFLRGGTGFDGVLDHPDRRSLLVIAGGQAYVVDVETRYVSTFGGCFTAVVHRERDRIVFATLTELEAYSTEGLQWRTRRLSWDGFRSFRVDGQTLFGEVWTPDRGTVDPVSGRLGHW